MMIMTMMIYLSLVGTILEAAFRLTLRSTYVVNCLQITKQIDYCIDSVFSDF